MLKKFVFKKISTIEIPKSSKLHRYVNKVRKLSVMHDINVLTNAPKIINLNKMAIPKKAYLLSFFRRHALSHNDETKSKAIDIYYCFLAM